MSDELGDFTILGILLPSDDEVDEAGRVPEDRGCVCLRHPHKAGRVHLEGHNEDVADGVDAAVVADGTDGADNADGIDGVDVAEGDDIDRGRDGIQHSCAI